MLKITSHQASKECIDLFWAGELLQKKDQTFNTWLKVFFYFEIL
jgi:hypothetical protein